MEEALALLSISRFSADVGHVLCPSWPRRWDGCVQPPSFSSSAAHSQRLLHSLTLLPQLQRFECFFRSKSSSSSSRASWWDKIRFGSWFDRVSIHVSKLKRSGLTRDTFLSLNFNHFEEEANLLSFFFKTKNMSCLESVWAEQKRVSLHRL